MKNVKKLLIFVALSTFVFASWTRTDALGGAKFWADDYANISAFPASINNHTVAYTNGMDFTTIFNQDGTTWGFSGGTGDDVANIMWGDGKMGVTFGLGMTPEVTAEDAAADATGATTAADASTDLNIGFGMPLAGGDFGFGYNDKGKISLNHRRAQNVWLWDNMVVGFGMTPEKKAADNNGMFQQSNMSLNADCYTVKSYDGGTSALFGLGFAYSADGDPEVGDAPDAKMAIEWNFAVESQMTDWAALRVGYSHGYDFSSGGTDDGGFVVGLGFNYGSFNLDMNLNTEDTNDDGSNLFTDPVKYVTGRNAEPLGAQWTISYNW